MEAPARPTRQATQAGVEARRRAEKSTPSQKGKGKGKTTVISDEEDEEDQEEEEEEEEKEAMKVSVPGQARSATYAGTSWAGPKGKFLFIFLF